MAHFRNDSGHPLNLDRFGLYVPVDAVFDVYDDDADSLRQQPSFTEVDSAGTPLVAEQDDEGGAPATAESVTVPPVVISSVVLDPAPAAAAVDAPVEAPTEAPTTPTIAPVAE